MIRLVAVLLCSLGTTAMLSPAEAADPPKDPWTHAVKYEYVRDGKVIETIPDAWARVFNGKWWVRAASLTSRPAKGDRMTAPDGTVYTVIKSTKGSGSTPHFVLDTDPPYKAP